MNPRYSGLALVAVILLAFGCGDGLKEYRSEDGGFSILLPGEPRSGEDPELPKAIHKVTFEERSGSYTVAWQDLPREGPDPEVRLDQACDGAAKRLKGKISKVERIHLPGGAPGREIILEWPDGTGIVHERMYLVNQRMYHVNASGPHWWVDSGKTRKVLSSFHLDEE